MERALEKIRGHTSSSLPHQRTPATLLAALEATLVEQNADKTPTAYFAMLLTTLEGTIQKNEMGMGEGDILPGVLYLLALVIPFVPQPVIQSNLSTILKLTSPLFPLFQQNAPPLRSQLTIYQSLLLALDRTQVEVQGIRQSFATILQLCLDPRPKVRKRAADLVRDILIHPPTPMVRHPYAERVADWVKGVLAEISQGPIQRAKQGKTTSNGGTEHGIHLLAFMKPILTHLPPSSLPAISTLLLALPRLGNTYLSQSSYSVLSDLCTLGDDEDTNPTMAAIPEIIKVILSFPPARSDTSLSCTWIHLIGTAMLAYRHCNSNDWAGEVSKAWKTVWAFLESKEASIRKEAANTLSVLASCFDMEMVERSGSDSSSSVAKIVVKTTGALDSLQYAHCIPEVLVVISSLMASIATHRPEVAEQLFTSVIQHIGQLRTEKSFEHREAADEALSTAMQTLGPHVILRLLPLNLEHKDRQDGNEPRAYLLPLLAQPHPSPLSHFVSFFVPLSERMFDLQQKAEIDGRQSEVKVWDVLVAQTWAGFAGYCHGTPDLSTALSAQFSQLLSQLLYSQPSLRLPIVKALKTMVDSNVAIAASKETVNPSRISPEQARKNVEFLSTQAESWLSVFFNVFGSIGRQHRNLIGDLISAWVGVAGEQNVAKAYQKVIALFKTNVQLAGQGSHGSDDNLLVVTLDLLIIILPAISPVDSQNLFELCSAQEVLCAKDTAVQKRAYKVLSKLVDSGKVEIDTAAFIQRVATWSESLLPAAKRDRSTLLTGLVAKLDSSSLHVIQLLIPEAVLATKEPSDKARSAAFDLVVTMGQRMAQGGTVKRDMIDGMDEDDAKPANASIEEFMMMMAGGLAGATPHMISASVTAISRLVFEFKDVISSQMHSEIFTTLLVFLTSANREIIKSVLGFVKLAIHTLPVDIIRPHLKDLVLALLSWSHDHKNHFKVKVRHIFERLLRRFPWDEVYGVAQDEEAVKVLINIKKRKDRAKRRKANKEEGSDDEADAPKATAGDAFEDVLYGSESELDDSDDEDVPQQQGKPSASQRKFEGARIRLDNDEPMDLLHGAATKVTTAGNGKKRKPGQEASKFKTDEDTGKMVIDDEDATVKADAGDLLAGAAYRESISSVDGFKRGPNGQVKFNKDTKKRRREEEDADVEMDDAEGTQKPKSKRKSDVKLGHEFKSKKAGGDVAKKGKVDPYAYVTLQQASKGKGKKNRIGIAGKQ